ncbi:DUF397 domain-containing protein [Streptomyces alanosinicus]|uniref:DUF397 domain-containing protein n=1 Tax=Streptomyces alanosinicus TaxID=68171 RepID=A0A918YMC4_9ACTN|nr:DUF397 domain-containing protein [Streptomyces alanosinicus]GHE08531.1 hypothetical protein GCM10010339_57640 [Streptomyces alanosinicus]
MTSEPKWRTSTYTKSDSCVEVADDDPAAILVRDTKHRDHGRMHVHPPAWTRFIDFTKRLPLD